MTATCLSNSIFVGTKVAMLFSRQVFTKSVITWAPLVSWLEPKTCCKSQDKIYASMMRISCFVYVCFSIKQHLCREGQAISLGRQRHDQGYVYLYVELRVYGKSSQCFITNELLVMFMIFAVMKAHKSKLWIHSIPRGEPQCQTRGLEGSKDWL